MTTFNAIQNAFVGEHGELPVQQCDEIARKLAMLIEGECEGGNRAKTAEKYGFTRQRYYQILDAYRQGGAAMLQSKSRGPKRRYRATIETVRQVIRYRFMDTDVSAQVIAQKLNQTGWGVSIRTVERIIQEYGLQKKTA
jgi:transposase